MLLIIVKAKVLSQSASLNCEGQYKHGHWSNEADGDGHSLKDHQATLCTLKLSTFWPAEAGSILVIEEALTAHQWLAA